MGFTVGKIAHPAVGLRGKAILALALACLLALLPAAFVGWRVLDNVRNHFGEAYARNFTQLKRESIAALISRELALSQRFADSVLVRQWLQDEENPEKKAQFFAEADGYNKDFRDHTWFLASAGSGAFYANELGKPYSDAPRYVLDPAKEADSWFFSSIERAEPYNINVNYDDYLAVTRVWINVIIRDGARGIGIAGTGIDLSSFLKEFIASSEPGVTPMILSASGAIQAHRKADLIAKNQAGSKASLDQTLAGQLLAGAERDRLNEALVSVAGQPGEVGMLHVTLDGKPQLLALSYIPELKWYIVTAVDLKAAQVLDKAWLNTAIAAVIAVLLVLLAAFSYAVDILVLKPLGNLRRSVLAVADGDFDIALPPPRRDELGDLSRAFGTMATKIRSNTDELENRIQARTRDLEAANHDLRRTQKQINDSIDYASLIQRAILPDTQLAQKLDTQYFALWRPRDVVGGDFYVFRHDGDHGNDRYLAGVVDCAGHGVPGALMTMLARSALDHAMNETGIDSPAAILTHADATMRGMLQACELPRAIATNMDAGLAYIDPKARLLRYAGAKISLYYSDGVAFSEIKGARRALGDRRQGSYTDHDIALAAGVTYYLATDGFLDQAGGDHGYGFGNTRFSDLLLRHARLPMHEQAMALEAALESYRGAYPQRDDITVLSFRFD